MEWFCRLISTVTLLKALWKLAPPNNQPLGCQPHGPRILSRRCAWSTKTHQKGEERPCPWPGSGADQRQLYPCTASGNTTCPGMAVPHSCPPGHTGGGCGGRWVWEKLTDLDEGRTAPPGGTESGSWPLTTEPPRPPNHHPGFIALSLFFPPGPPCTGAGRPGCLPATHCCRSAWWLTLGNWLTPSPQDSANTLDT